MDNTMTGIGGPIRERIGVPFYGNGTHCRSIRIYRSRGKYTKGWTVESYNDKEDLLSKFIEKFQIIGWGFGSNPDPSQYYDFNPGIRTIYDPFGVEITNPIEMYYTRTKTRIGDILQLYEVQKER